MTGVVLGGGVVLGPSALSKLAVTPSIFFVNCCHLGEIDAAAEDKSRQASLAGGPELAASVAVALVQLGVRCVVVAGWAVDDDPAEAFGECFYREMLGGASFGVATLRARQKAYEKWPNSNTWGAYQSYGDPDYRLHEVAPNSADAGGADQFVAIPEAIEAARQIREDVNIGLERDLDAQRSRLVGIEKEALTRNWLGSDSAELRVALAEARAELGDFSEAVEHYEAAVSSADASYKVRAVEQLANLRVRSAVAAFRQPPTEGRDPAQTIGTIQASLTAIQALSQAAGETLERLSLQGSCWKRLAQVQESSSAADEALKKMADCYDRAAAIGGPERDYPNIMACNARICLAVRSGTNCDREIGETLQRLGDTKPSDDADFWKLIKWADVRMNLAILGAPAPSVQLGEIEKAYKRAWRHVGSPVKLMSVVEQFQFYEDIFAGGAESSGPTRKNIVEWVAKLRHVLETESEFVGKKPD